MFKGGRCLCIDSGVKAVKMAAIEKVSIIYPSNGCDKVEVIVTLKGHKGQRCLDPRSKQGRLIMQTIQKKNILRRQNMWWASWAYLTVNPQIRALRQEADPLLSRNMHPFYQIAELARRSDTSKLSAWLWKYLSHRVMCLCAHSKLPSVVTMDTLLLPDVGFKSI